jgi:hypothetical protein
LQPDLIANNFNRIAKKYLRSKDETNQHQRESFQFSRNWTNYVYDNAICIIPKQTEIQNFIFQFSITFNFKYIERIFLYVETNWSTIVKWQHIINFWWYIYINSFQLDFTIICKVYHIFINQLELAHHQLYQWTSLNS